jgi:hypothetical protein
LPHDLVGLEADEHVAVVEVGVQRRGRVLGEREQRPQLRPRAAVELDAGRDRRHRAVIAEVEHEQRFGVWSGSMCEPPEVNSRWALLPGKARNTSS